MTKEFSAVTVQLPNGYFATHLLTIANLCETFRDVRVTQVGYGPVSVRASPETDDSREVVAWVAKYMDAG